MTRRHQSNNFFDNIKDYIVPIIGIFIICFLIYSLIFSGGGEKPEDKENKNGIAIVLQGSDTKGKIFFSDGDSQAITPTTKLYKSEKAVASEGRLTIKKEGEYAININTRGEVLYKKDKYFSISNGEVWLDSEADMNVDMKYLNASVSKNSHISVVQNEVISTIYVVAGMVEIKTNSGNKVLLSKGEMLEISRSESVNKEVDLKLKKKAIDDIFKNTAWYTLNNGNSYVVAEEEKEKEEKDGKDGKDGEDEKDGEGTNTTVNNKKALHDSAGTLISFSNLVDGANVSGETINIYGNYTSEDVVKIVLNNKINAKLVTESTSFSLEKVDISNKVNDLVFKVYDSTNTEIDKFIYTIYNNSTSSKNGKVALKKPQIVAKNFSVDAGDFSFTSPSKNPLYTTYEKLVTIKGKVLAKGITKVTVNGYKLKSFKGSSWLYHANEDFGNMKEGTNEYEIKYHKGETLVYKNYFTIVKKTNNSAEKTEIQE